MEIDRIDEQFGPSVRLLRLDRGMSQDELASAVSKFGYPVSQATVGKIERGDRKVSVGEAEAIARALGTSSSALMLGPSNVSRELLEARLRSLREELVDSMRVFESAQQLVAIEARQLDEYDRDWLRDAVLESIEDVVTEYRRDRESENVARAHRDELDGPNTQSDIDGLYGEHEKKFGMRADRIPHVRAWQTIIGRSSQDA